MVSSSCGPDGSAVEMLVEAEKDSAGTGSLDHHYDGAGSSPKGGGDNKMLGLFCIMPRFIL